MSRISIISMKGWQAVVLVMTMAPCFGCANPPRSTRMTTDDLETISQELAAGLAASDIITDRGSNSPLWVVSIDKVQNLSSDVMTEGEQWSVVHRIRGSLPIQALWTQKNIRFVVPPDRRDALQASGEFESYGSTRRPTHQMTVTFRSVTRADAQHRSELYYCEFELIDLLSSQLVWSDKYEYKRAAVGHVWD